MRFSEEMRRLMTQIEVRDHGRIKQAIDEIINAEQESDLINNMQNLAVVLEEYVKAVNDLVENIKIPMLMLAHDTLKNRND